MGWEGELFFVFTAEKFSGELIDCDEGELLWVEKSRIDSLNIWPGDRIFFKLIERNEPFFSLKLVYDGKGELSAARLNGRPLDIHAIL